MPLVDCQTIPIADPRGVELRRRSLAQVPYNADHPGRITARRMDSEPEVEAAIQLPADFNRFFREQGSSSWQPSASSSAYTTPTPYSAHTPYSIPTTPYSIPTTPHSAPPSHSAPTPMSHDSYTGLGFSDVMTNRHRPIVHGGLDMDIQVVNEWQTGASNNIHGFSALTMQQPAVGALPPMQPYMAPTTGYRDTAGQQGPFVMAQVPFAVPHSMMTAQPTDNTSFMMTTPSGPMSFIPGPASVPVGGPPAPYTMTGPTSSIFMPAPTLPTTRTMSMASASGSLVPVPPVVSPMQLHRYAIGPQDTEAFDLYIALGLWDR